MAFPEAKDITVLKVITSLPDFTSIIFGLIREEPGVIYITATSITSTDPYTFSYTCTIEEEETLTNIQNPAGVKATFQHIVDLALNQLRVEVGHDMILALSQAQEMQDAGRKLH